VTSLLPGELDAFTPDDEPVGPPKLAIRALSAWFGRERVLRELTLPIHRDRVTALIGPSGCGKSTLLRCLNRMHELAPGARPAGAVEIDGVDVYGPRVDPTDVRRRVGIVFQRPTTFPGASVRDDVLAGWSLAGHPPRRREEAAERILRRVGLWDEVKDALGRPSSTLSMGQKQRLCIARCLALEPEVLLMDEPTSSLDPIATARVEELLNELRATVSVVLVTHSMQQAARVADFVAFLDRGALVEHAPSRVLFTNPADARTEAYITGRYG
jgi:phosphate transport system ATP-binding protein